MTTSLLNLEKDKKCFVLLLQSEINKVKQEQVFQQFIVLLLSQI